MKIEDIEVLGRQKTKLAISKPDPVNWPVKTDRAIMRHHNGSTETVSLIFHFLQTSVISQFNYATRLGYTLYLNKTSQL